MKVEESMKEDEIEEMYMGEILCPSCERGTITRFHMSGNAYPSTDRIQLYARAHCPYCGDVILLSPIGVEVSHAFTKTTCKHKKVVVLDK